MSKPEQTSKWTEIEYLPAWDEPFYDVYTARKFGKWVMLKTLKKKYRDDPQHADMMEKEFDVRYNLSHPNIVMINDFEEVPDLGMCIITDDVYGPSLRMLLDENRLTDAHYAQLLTRLPQAMEYIQQNHLAHHTIRPETIIFTENIGNLKLIDVGFDQKTRLSHSATEGDVEAYGRVMLEVLNKTGRRDPAMQRIATRAATGGYRDVQSLQMAITGRRGRPWYLAMAALVGILAAALAWLLANPRG